MKTFQNKISIKKIEILKLFLFLNNARLLLLSRKFINNLIKIIIRENKNLRISSKKYLLNLSVYRKFWNDYNVIKNYISNFIVKFTDKNEPDYKYNCLIDFLYFIKSYFNDNIHYVELNKDITFNEKFYSLFNEGMSTKEKSSSEEEKNEIMNKEETAIDSNICQKLPNLNNENNNLKGRGGKILINDNINNDLKVINKFDNKKGNNINDLKDIKYPNNTIYQNKEDIFTIKYIEECSFKKISNKINDLTNLIYESIDLSSQIDSISNENENSNIFNFESIIKSQISLFSFENLKQSSINNLKKKFINYFNEELDIIISEKYQTFIDKKNEEIEYQYKLINNLLDKCEIIYNNSLKQKKNSIKKSKSNNSLKGYFDVGINNIKNSIQNNK